MTDREPRFDPNRKFYDAKSLAARLLERMQYEEGDRDEWMHFFLPRSSFQERILDSGFNYEAINALNINRLSGIRQLSFLSLRLPTYDDPSHDIVFDFPHTRFEHSVLVGLLMEKVMQRNGFARDDISKGKIGSFIHDRGMPAMGDATKALDPKNLNEEVYWYEGMSEKGHAFLDKHGMGAEDVTIMLRNEGTLGSLLDIIDRIAYTSFDLGATLSHAMAMDNPRYYELYRLFEGDLTLGDVYRDILYDRDQGEFFFNDPHRLGRFLQARAMLHYSLYRNPYSAGRDRLFSRFIEPFYSTDEGSSAEIVTPKRLRRMVDNDLLGFLGKKYRIEPFFFGEDLRKWQPGYVEVLAGEEATDVARSVTETPGLYVIDTLTMHGFKTGVDYLARDDKGIVRPFSEIEPELSAILDETRKATEGTYVFYVDLNQNDSITRIIRSHLIPYRERATSRTSP